MRVFWKEYEKQAVALKASEIYHSDKEHAAEPRSWRKSLVAAQYEVLANPARHKPAASFVTWPKSMLDEFFELGNRLRIEKARIEKAKADDFFGGGLLSMVEAANGARAPELVTPPAPALAAAFKFDALGVAKAPSNAPVPSAGEMRPITEHWQQQPQPTPIPVFLQPPPQPAQAPAAQPNAEETNNVQITPEQMHYNTSRKVSALIKLMVRHTVTSFENQLEQALTEAMDHAFEDVHKRVTARVSHLAVSSRVIKPTVAIIGLLAKFYEDINKEYDDFFRITFISKDNENKDLMSRLKAKDYVIVNTDFTSHSITDTIRSHPGLIFVSGNNAVKEKLLELAANI